MTRSDGESAGALRKRKSKRFDRSGGAARSAGSAVAEADTRDEPMTQTGLETMTEAVAAPVDTEPMPTTSPPSGAMMQPTTRSIDMASPDAGPVHPAPSMTGPEPTFPPDAPVRSKTLDQLATCGRCGHEVSMINIEVDSTVLVMESCDNCDTRRWHLAGEQIDLQDALDHVGEHAGRRR